MRISANRRAILLVLGLALCLSLVVVRMGQTQSTPQPPGKGRVDPKNNRAKHKRLSFTFTDTSHTGKFIIDVDAHSAANFINLSNSTCFFNYIQASDGKPANQQWTFHAAIAHGTGKGGRVTLVFITGTKPTDIKSLKFKYTKNGRQFDLDLSSGDVTVSVPTDDTTVMDPDDLNIDVDELAADPCA
jgi:hypothetical protein